MDKKANNKPLTNATNAKQSGNIGKRSYSVKFLCILLAIISFAVYANTLQNGYVLDDATVITKNTIVMKGFKGIPELLVTPRLKGFEQSKDEESYRPVPMITHAIEYELFGANAMEGHLFNIVLFIGCVIALFLFLNKLLSHKKTGIAFLAALLFALHPIHTEVVANIKSRDELLCFLFAFVSLNVFINYMRQGKALQLVTGAVMLLLSLLSKETAITFLFIIPLVFFFYVNENRKRSISATVAMVIVTLCFLTTRAALLGTHHTNAITFLSNPLISAQDISWRIATAMLVLGNYLKLLFVPYPLICDYSYNSIPLVGFGNVFVLLSLTVYLLVTVIAVYRLIKIPKDLWAFGILFFLGTIALFSNLFFLVYSEMAERFLFFASAGFSLCLALGYDRWVAKAGTMDMPVLKNKRVLMVIVPVCLFFSILTVARNAEWKDNYTLYSTDLKKSPNDCELYFYLSTEISQNMYAEEPNPANKQQMDLECIEYLNRAVDIYPDFDGAHAELGRIFERLQMYDSAIVHDARALAINPANSIASYNLARAYYFLKRYPEAIEFFRKTISIQPDIVFANLNLAKCYFESMQYDSAIVYFNKTLALDPEQQLAKQGLAYAYAMKSKSDTTAKTNETITPTSH